MSFDDGDDRPLRRTAQGGKESYTTFTRLGGRAVSLDEVRRHLSELPLDLVLGVLARISAHHVRDGRHFFGVDAQGPYLNYAIADDFPEPLRGAAAMYAPGRVPITGGVTLSFTSMASRRSLNSLSITVQTRRRRPSFRSSTSEELLGCY